MINLRTRRTINLLATLAVVVPLGSCAGIDRYLGGNHKGGPTREVEQRSSRPEATTPNLRKVTDQTPSSTEQEARRSNGPQLFRGTGVFTKRPRRRPATATEENGGVTLNFIKEDIRAVVSSVLGKILNVSYALHPKAKGLVTVQTMRPVPRGQLLATMEAVLRLNGFAIVRIKDIYNVVPLADARRGAPIRVGRSGHSDEGYRVQVVPLRHIPAKEMQKILEPLAPKGSVLRVDEARNLLVLADTGPNLEGLLEAVEIFDVDWLAGMSFGLFPVQFAEATVLAEELTNMLGGGGEYAIGGLVRFVPVERLNAIMVITQRPSFLEQAQKWIERLDYSDDKTGRRVHVYRVKNAEAAKLAPLLMEIFSVGGSQAAMGSIDRAASSKGGTIKSVTASTERARIVSAGNRAINQPVRSPKNEKRLGPADTRNGNSTALRDTAVDRSTKHVSATLQQVELSQESKFKILADEEHNSLVIMATPEEYRAVAAALRELDIVPLQVMVEATIISVSLNDDLKYGVQWFFESGNHQFNFQTAEAIGLAIPGFSYFFGTATKKMAIDALSKVTDVKVLSSPQVLVLDNHTAVLQVGDQVPVATQQSVGSTDDARTVNTIQFRDAGVTLRVTPRVNPGGLVRMEIEQEVSSVKVTTSSTIDSPTVDQQKIKSTVVIQSGESVALGGLIKESNSKGNTGIPFLKDIPLLGWLFGSTSNNQEREELIVIITPRVVGSQEDARTVTTELRRRMEGISRWFPKNRQIKKIK